MNNQDQDTRFQRYDFTPKRSQVKRKRHHPHIWPWILGLIIVVLILTFGIRYVLNNSTQVTNHGNKVPATTKSSSSSSNSSDSHTKATHSNSTPSPASVTQTTKNSSSGSVSDNNSDFAEAHTFNSLQDAKNWANATKPDWTAAGYNYWTVNQNSQGYYVLTFTK